MRRYLPSASKLPLILEGGCGFAWSPNAPRWPAQTYGKAASHGKASHAVAERVLSNEPADIHAQVVAAGVEGKAETRRAETVARHVATHYEALRPTATVWDIERPIAWDSATGACRYLGGNRAGRAYSKKRDGEIAGTLDQAAIFPDRIEIFDLKTGVGARQSSASASPQMKFYALCLSRIHNQPNVTITYLHADEDGVTPDAYVIQPGELDAFEAELREMVDGLATAMPKPGWHCHGMWCPIVSNCPATLKALAEIDIAASPLAPPLNVAITSPEHAASVRVRLRMVQAAALAVEESLKAYLRANGPVEIAPGMWYGPKEETREVIDIASDGAYGVLVKHLGSKADTAVELDTSKSAVQRAAGSKKKAEEIFEDLRKVGAMRETHYSKLAEWKAK